METCGREHQIATFISAAGFIFLSAAIGTRATTLRSDLARLGKSGPSWLIIAIVLAVCLVAVNVSPSGVDYALTVLFAPYWYGTLCYEEWGGYVGFTLSSLALVALLFLVGYIRNSLRLGKSFDPTVIRLEFYAFQLEGSREIGLASASFVVLFAALWVAANQLGL
jgi:hypothetical protein